MFCYNSPNRLRQGESIPLPFPASRGCPYSLACGPLSPSSKQTTEGWRPLMLSSFWFSEDRKGFPYLRIHVINGSIWIIEDNLLISRSLTLITSAKFLCHTREHIHKFWGLDIGIFGGHYSVYHRYFVVRGKGNAHLSLSIATSIMELGY